MKTKVSKTTNILLRILIMLFIFVFVYKQILEKNDLSAWLDIWKMISSLQKHYYTFALVLLLLPVNIFFESLKWKKLIDKLEFVKMNKAFTAVLSGISVSMFLPNRVGDYLGRVFVLNHASHIKGILATIIGSLAQLLTTILIGMMALIAFVPRLLDFSEPAMLYLYIGIIVAIIIVLVFLIGLYFNVGLLKAISGILFKRKSNKIEGYLEVFSLYSKLELFVVLALSFGRYLVFSFQFYLLFHIFGFSVHYFDAMVLISLIYLAMTLIPTIAITELAVRGSVALSLFDIYFKQAQIWTENAPVAVIAASSALWIINLALPALIGAFFVFRLKFIRKGIDEN